MDDVEDFLEEGGNQEYTQKAYACLADVYDEEEALLEGVEEIMEEKGI